MEQTFEILINELVADEEFRNSFLRNPHRALHLAGDWVLPLCESEIRALMTTSARGGTRFAKKSARGFRWQHSARREHRDEHGARRRGLTLQRPVGQDPGLPSLAATGAATAARRFP